MSGYRYLKIIGITAIILLTAAMALFLITDHQKEQKQKEHLQMLADEARPYEKEIADIRRAVSAMERTLSDTSERAGIVICYQIKTLENWEQIQRIMKDYDFKATVVIDVAAPFTDTESMLTEIDKAGWDVMLEGNPADEAAMKQAGVLKTGFKERGIICSNVWFLSAGTYSNENIDSIIQYGYAGFSQTTDYGSNISSGLLSNGIFYFEHIPVFDGDNKADSSIQLGIREKKIIAFSINMDMFNNTSGSETVTEDTIRTLLDKAEQQADQNLCVVERASDVEYYYHEEQLAVKKLQREYDEFVEIQDAEIEKLQGNIDKIYSSWDEY